jgi:hypothetical protein
MVPEVHRPKNTLMFVGKEVCMRAVQYYDLIVKKRSDRLV